MQTTKLTLQSVRALLRTVNVIITKSDGEYAVYLRGEKSDAYFTNDLLDARDTGLVIGGHAAEGK